MKEDGSTTDTPAGAPGGKSAASSSTDDQQLRKEREKKEEEEKALAKERLQRKKDREFLRSAARALPGVAVPLEERNPEFQPELHKTLRSSGHRQQQKQQQQQQQPDGSAASSSSHHQQEWILGVLPRSVDALEPASEETRKDAAALADAADLAVREAELQTRAVVVAHRKRQTELRAASRAAARSSSSQEVAAAFERSRSAAGTDSGSHIVEHRISELNSSKMDPALHHTAASTPLLRHGKAAAPTLREALSRVGRAATKHLDGVEKLASWEPQSKDGQEVGLYAKQDVQDYLALARDDGRLFAIFAPAFGDEAPVRAAGAASAYVSELLEKMEEEGNTLPDARKCEFASAMRKSSARAPLLTEGTLVPQGHRGVYSPSSGERISLDIRRLFLGPTGGSSATFAGLFRAVRELCEAASEACVEFLARLDTYCLLYTSPSPRD